MRKRSWKRAAAFGLALALAFPQTAAAGVVGDDGLKLTNVKASQSVSAEAEETAEKEEAEIPETAENAAAAEERAGQAAGNASDAVTALEAEESAAPETGAADAVVIDSDAEEETGEPADAGEAQANYPPAGAAENECGTDLTWAWDEGTGTLTLTGSGDMYDYTSASEVPWASYRTLIQHVVMPDEVTGIGKYTFYGLTVAQDPFPIPAGVTFIGDYAFTDSTFGGSELTLPAALELLGNYAFKGCTGVQNLTITGELNKIGDYAFQSCTGLKSLTIGGKVETIGTYAFQGCTGLVDVTLLNGVITIGDYAFESCSGIQTLEFTGSVEKIGNYAFQRCIKLKNLTIPNGVEIIGERAFTCCTNLQGNLEIPRSVTTLGKQVFAGCTGYTGSLIIRSGLSTISQDAFNSCAFRSITLPSTLKTVETGAFWGHQAREIVIPALVTSIKGGAFIGDNLKSIYFKGNSPTLSDEGYNVNYYVDYRGYVSSNGRNNEYPFGTTSGKTIYYVIGKNEWPDSWTWIDNLFAGYSTASIAESDIPADENSGEILDSLTPIIGECGTDLTYTISGTPAGLTLTFSGRGDMYDYTSADKVPWYSYRNSILHVVLPDGVTSIGKYAFYDFPVVQGNYPIPSSITTIGSYAFYMARFTSLKLELPEGLNLLGEYAFYNSRGINELTIPGTLDKIGAHAFQEGRNIKTVKIEDGMEVVDTYAFQNCNHLVSTELDGKVETIGDYAFENCGEMQTLDFSGSVEKIGNYAFQRCKSLKKLMLPEGLKSIGERAFTCCTNLQGNLEIPQSVTSLGARAFAGCTGYTGSLIIRSGLSTISLDAFNSCAFRSITLPSTLKTVETGAFWGHQAREIVIPALVTSIKGGAFIGDNLKSIFFKGNSPTLSDEGYNVNYYVDYRGYVSSNWRNNEYPFGSSSDITLYYISTKAGWSDTLNGYTCVAAAESDFPAEETGEPVAVTGVSLDKTTISLKSGESVTLKATVSPAGATNKSVTWESSDTNVALVTSAGKVTALAEGSAVITAKTADGGFTASCTVSVTESAPETVAVTGVSLNQTEAELEEGKTLTLKATVSPATATDKSVTWRSAKSAVASVDANGVVTAVSEGTAVIVVTTTDGSFTDTCTVTVKKGTPETVAVTGVALNQNEAELEEGKMLTLRATVSPVTATDKSVTWRSARAAVASVDANGVVTAVSEGTAVIVVTTKDGGFTDTCTVTVKKGTPETVAVTGVALNQNEAELEEGKTLTLTATVSPTNASDPSVTWRSLKTAVASVDANGVVTAVSEGTAVIIVTTKDGGFMDTCTVTVTKAAPETVPVSGVSLNQTEAELEIGGSFTLRTTVSPGNATNSAVSFSSGTPAVASVDANGVVTAVSAGTAQITVTTADGGFTASCLVTVKEKESEAAEDMFLVIFYSEDEKVGEELVAAGETVTNLPVMDDTFVGWYDDVTDKLWDATMPVTKAMRLYARFKAEEAETQEQSGRDSGLNVVEISEEEHVYMVKGQSYAFDAKDADNKAITWKVSASGTKIIKISSKYKAKALAATDAKIGIEGDTGIYVYCGDSEENYTKRYTVHVVDPYLEAVSGSGETEKTEKVKGTLTLLPGMSKQLQMAVDGPEDWAEEYPVSWTTSNEEVAKVDDGMVHTLTKGSAKITAYVNGKAYACTVKVVDVIKPGALENEADVILSPLQTVSLKFTDKTFKMKNLIWTNAKGEIAVSKNKKGVVQFYQDDVVRVTPAGKITAVGVGTTTLTATSGDASKTITVTVNRPASTILYMNTGKTKTLKFYNVKNNKVDWKLVSPEMVNIVGDMVNGKAKGREVGIAKVTGTYAPYSFTDENGRVWGAGITYTATIYVENPKLSGAGAVTDLNKTSLSGKLALSKEGTALIQVEGVYQPVVFTSGKPAVAFVDEAGVVSARSAGKATLSARVNGKKLSVNVTVK